MSSTPSFAEAFIISDLHLGGEPGRQMFESGEAFERFIEHVVAATTQAALFPGAGRVLLAINGDFVDFLAEPEPLVFNVKTPVASIDRIFTDQTNGFPQVLAGLRKFVGTSGAHLVITLGNHDLELCLPAARARLLELLTNGIDDRKGRIEFCFDGWGYRFEVGGKPAICLHGNEVDDYNFTRYDELDVIIHELMLFGGSDFVRGWCPSAGSRFVIEAINPIKGRFPFVDLLKPESLVQVLLPLLDPSMIKHVDDAFRLGREKRANDAARPASQRRMLATPVAASAGFDTLIDQRISISEDELEDSVEFSIGKDRIEERIYRVAEQEMLGIDVMGAVRNAAKVIREKSVDLFHTTVDTLKGTAREAHWRIVQQTLRPFTNDDPYNLSTADSYDRAVRDVVKRQTYSVIFAGHSHLRRLVEEANYPTYVNTGTWAGLMGLSKSDVNSAGFEAIYDALRDPRRAKLREQSLITDECTVARMRVVGEKTVVELGSFPLGLPAKMQVDAFAELKDPS